MALKISDNVYYILLTLITLPIVIYSYLKVVFNDDIHIFFGVEKLATFFGSFPANVDIAWETRPVGNRLIFYGLYKIFQSISNNEFLFQIGVKGLAAVVILIVCGYFAYQVSKRVTTPNKYAIFLLTCISIFSLHIMFLMETEFIATVAALLTIALLLSESKYAHFMAGFILFGIFILKFVTIIFIPITIAAWILLEKKLKAWTFMKCLFGIEVAAALFVISCFIWFKHFFSDLWLTIILHDTSSFGIGFRTYEMLIQSLAVPWFMPVMFIGLLAGVLVFIDYIKQKNKLLITAFILMWVSPLLSTYIQSEFFLYHYTGLIIPAVISIIIFLTTNYQKHTKVIFTLVLIITSGIFFMSCSIWTDTHAHIWDNQISNASIIKEKFNISDKTTILYLDTGTTAYFLGAPSACRYTYPLITNRGYAIEKVNSSLEYANAKSCIMNYTGKYIVALDWSLNGDPDISTKVKSEYTKVYNGSWWSYKDETGDLYERKDMI
jgi:hypothetical protein